MMNEWEKLNLLVFLVANYTDRYASRHLHILEQANLLSRGLQLYHIISSMLYHSQPYLIKFGR